MDCRSNAVVRAAATDVGHRSVDIIVRRIGPLSQQRHSRHDLPGLAIAALRNIKFLPCELDRVCAVGGKTLDSYYLGAGGGLDGEGTGSRRSPVDMDGAGAALPDPASKLGAGKPDGVAENPQQRRLRFHLHNVTCSIDRQNESHSGSQYVS